MESRILAIALLVLFGMGPRMKAYDLPSAEDIDCKEKQPNGRTSGLWDEVMRQPSSDRSGVPKNPRSVH